MTNYLLLGLSVDTAQLRHRRDDGEESAAEAGAGNHWLPALTAAGTVIASAATRLAYRPSATAGDWTGSWRLDVLTALCAGTVCAVMLIVLRGSGGLGHALYAAPTSAVLTATVLWAARFGSWKHVRGVGLAVFLLMLAVPVGLLPPWGSSRRAVHLAVPALAAIAAAAVLALQHSGDALLLPPSLL